MNNSIKEQRDKGNSKAKNDMGKGSTEAQHSIFAACPEHELQGYA